MNDFFSFRRFGYLFRKTLLERPVQLTGLTGLILLVTALIYVLGRMIIPFEEAQNFSFISGLVGGGSLLASFAFNYFSSAASGFSYLTLPASHFEKWLCGILITGVLFFGLYLLFFRALDLILVHLYHNSLDPNDPYYREHYDAVNNFPLKGFVAGKAYITFLNTAGAMLIGSLYFNKASFIKSALIACSLFIAGHLLNHWIAKIVFDSVDKSLPYYCAFISVGKEVGKVVLPDYADTAVEILLYVFPAILWSITWLRLSEKEF